MDSTLEAFSNLNDSGILYFEVYTVFHTFLLLLSQVITNPAYQGLILLKKRC